MNLMTYSYDSSLKFGRRWIRLQPRENIRHYIKQGHFVAGICVIDEFWGWISNEIFRWLLIGEKQKLLVPKYGAAALRSPTAQSLNLLTALYIQRHSKDDIFKENKNFVGNND